MDLKTAADWLDLIIENAPRVRAVGVTALSFGGDLEVQLREPDVQFDMDDQDGSDVPTETLPLPTLRRRPA